MQTRDKNRSKVESPLLSKKWERKKKNLSSQHACDKWVKISKKFREEEVTLKAQIKDIAKILKQVLPPQYAVPKF